MLQVDDAMEYKKEARKARNRALRSLSIGLGLVFISAWGFVGAYGIGAGGPDSSMAAIIAFLVIAGIVALTSVILLFVALGFFLQYVELKRHIKNNPVRGEAEEADEP